jgi:hypothetical protein
MGRARLNAKTLLRYFTGRNGDRQYGVGRRKIFKSGATFWVAIS